jgi:FK506-binding nuclear protein
MAAIDPSEPAEIQETANGTTRPRATLKIVRQPPSKSKKARKAAALQQLMDSIGGASDEEMEDAPNGTNGTKLDKKGKAKATSDDEEESDEESDDDEEEIEVEEFVLCTLDPEKVWKLCQPSRTVGLHNIELPAATGHYYCRK